MLARLDGYSSLHGTRGPAPPKGHNEGRAVVAAVGEEVSVRKEVGTAGGKYVAGETNDP